jgi:hypothetical protein
MADGRGGIVKRLLEKAEVQAEAEAERYLTVAESLSRRKLRSALEEENGCDGMHGREE